MDNNSLVEAMLKDCKKFENKEISVAELQNSLETYGPLLEGVGSTVFRKLHDFSNDLEFIQHARPLEKHYEETCKVVQGIRNVLSSL